MAVNLSFSGAGFLGMYQAGVVSCFQFYGRKLLDRIVCFGGCSAGAFAATALLCDIDLGKSLTFIMEIASKVRDGILGPLSPSFNPCQVIRETFQVTLPANAYKIASGKLFISLTRVSDFKNVIVSEFTSNRDLIDALVCTSFVPVYSGVIPPKYRGVYYVDGGATDNLLQHFEGTTITVSVFSGDSDICPDDGQKDDVLFDMNNATVQITSHNIHRLVRALLPNDARSLTDLCRQGFKDTLRYLHCNYPEMLSMDVNVVSVPYCCGSGYVEDDGVFEDANRVCTCGADNDIGFTVIEKQIAKGNVIESLMFPKRLLEVLSEAELAVSERDFFWRSKKVLTEIVEWLAHPFYYMTKHIYDIANDIFHILLPQIETYSSDNIIMQKILRTAKHAFHAYHGSGKCEWHPSLGADRHVDIVNTRRRLKSAEDSFVALRKHSLSEDQEDAEHRQRCNSVSSDGSDLPYGKRARNTNSTSSTSNMNNEHALKETTSRRPFSSSSVATFVALWNSSVATFVALWNSVFQEHDYGSELDCVFDVEECEEEGVSDMSNDEDEHFSPFCF